MTHPAVRTLPISRARLEEISLELHNSMETYSVIRRVLRPVLLANAPQRDLKREFHKIGVSEITDKVWFVDGSFPEGYYSVSGIGASYALGIAEPETTYLVNEISRAVNGVENIRYSDALTPQVIYDAASLLQGRGFDPTFVFTNVRDHVDLWRYHPPYGGFGRDTHLEMPGHRPLTVDFAPEIPEGTTYVLDRERFGTLVVKQDLDISVSTITDESKSAIIRELPEFKGQDLEEKVRLVIQEILRVDIDNQAAIIPIKRRAKPIAGG